MAKTTKKKNKNSSSAGDKILTALLYPLRIFLFYFLFQIVFRIYFYFCHRVRFDKNGKTLPKGNFVVLGNHVSNWDGLYINTYLKRFIYFIVHDEVFKYKLRKVIAQNLLGQVKRAKHKGDMEPLRKLMELKRSGKCIGIFPEGDISFSGRSLKTDLSTAKMCRILALPVVLVRIDGGSLRNPRWSKERRKTHVKLTITDVIPQEEVVSMGIKQLKQRIDTGISYDDCLYQQQKGGVIRAKNIAQNLENLLFICPDCEEVASLNSLGDILSCHKCGYCVRLQSDYSLKTLKGNLEFDYITQWDDYQKSIALKTAIRLKNQGKSLLTAANYSYNRVKKGEFFYKPQARGTLTLDFDAVRFTSHDGAVQETYPLSGIEGLYIQFLGAVEFNFGEYSYRFISRDNRHYGYRFECFINAIKNTTNDNIGEDLSNGEK